MKRCRIANGGRRVTRGVRQFVFQATGRGLHGVGRVRGEGGPEDSHQAPERREGSLILEKG